MDQSGSFHRTILPETSRTHWGLKTVLLTWENELVHFGPRKASVRAKTAFGETHPNRVVRVVRITFFFHFYFSIGGGFETTCLSGNHSLGIG